jgi:hypothetical protein
LSWVLVPALQLPDTPPVLPAWSCRRRRVSLATGERASVEQYLGGEKRRHFPRWPAARRDSEHRDPEPALVTRQFEHVADAHSVRGFDALTVQVHATAGDSLLGKVPRPVETSAPQPPIEAQSIARVACRVAC